MRISSESSSRLAVIGEEVVSGSFFIFISNVVYILVSAVGSIVIARLLGPEKYGLYALTLTIPFLIVVMLVSGLISVIVRSTIVHKIYGMNIRLGKFMRIYMALIMALISSYLVAKVVLDTSILGAISILKEFVELLITSSIFISVYITALPIVKAIDITDLNNFNKMSNNIMMLKSILRLFIVIEFKLLTKFQG